MATASNERTIQERRTGPVELLWDLVFVFAVTQVTSVLSADLTTRGLGRSLLVLALVWWAWSAFVWAANALDEEAPTLRLALLVALVLIFLTGVAIPSCFGGEALLFAFSYAGVRFLHLALYADASRRGNASWRAIAGFAVTVALGMGLLIAGAFIGGWQRDALWAVAVAIDYAGPAWLTRERLRGLQEVAVAHFAERYGLFIIICLGESILVVGASASSHSLDSGVVGPAALGLLSTVALWWIYFARTAAVAEERLREHRDPVLAAADSYSYLHLLLVAGIILFAVGGKLVLGASREPLPDVGRLALCGGIALYLLGHTAFVLRLVGRLDAAKVAAAAAAMILYALGSSLSAWVVAAALTAMLIALCAAEALSGADVPAH